MKTIKLPTLIIVLFLFSCRPDFEHPDEVLDLMPSLKEWIVEDPDLLEFRMSGSDSSSYLFEEDYSDISYQYGASSSKMFDYYVTHEEHFYQSYQINRGDEEMVITMSPSSRQSHGNLFSIELMGTKLGYDFTYHRVHVVRLEAGNSGGSSWGASSTKSTCTLLDSLAINLQVCDSVYHFKLADFEDALLPESVTEIFYAKHIGLVKFIRNDGTEVVRKW